MSLIKHILSKIDINLRGKKSKSKLVIIESDDWGSIRVEGKQRREALLNNNLISDKDPFSIYDSLERKEDIEALYSVLDSVKGASNNPVFTLNTVMCNPDFTKIKASGFQDFETEDFLSSYNHYHGETGVLELLESGMGSGLIKPQFHAKSHLNVSRWMSKLRGGDKRFRQAFDYNCFAIDESESTRRGNLMATYEYDTQDELSTIEADIVSGMKLFEDTFGYSSKSTVAPCYVWDDSIESIFSKTGICGLQGSKYQLVTEGAESFKFKRHSNLEKNKLGQYYTVRNVIFEPCTNPDLDWIDRCLKSIQIAFLLNKPVIIGTHRVNYTSGISKENRDKSLKLLHSLLASIVKNWPEVSFVSSPDILGYFES